MDGDNSLFPVIDIPEYDEGEEEDGGYRPSLAWDLEVGDFVQTSAHNMVLSEGVEAYKVWCVKTVYTERFSCLAYDDDIGVEMEDAMSEEDTETVELAVERTIEEALMADPRTEAVEGFEFVWDTDHLHVGFTVTASGIGSIPIDVDFDI